MESRKIHLIREYFKCRHEFDELHNTKIKFRKEPTNDDIIKYSKAFKIDDLEYKISAVKLQIDNTKKRLYRN